MNQTMGRDISGARRLILLQLGFLVLLYASGTFIRLAPISKWGVYVTADDPVLHVRVTEYVLENGHLPRNDSLAWYPWGQNWERTLPNFRYYLTAGLYSLGRSLGLGMSLYDFCVLFPAFFAPLAVFPMFLLIRELKGWRSGLVSAAVLVLSSGYLTRTIAGFYRHEQVGLPLLILSMYFFVRATKAKTLRSNLTMSILSGTMLVLLTGTWSGFRFLLDGYAVFAFLAMITGRMNRRLLSAFVITDGLALISTFFWPRLSTFYSTTELAIALVVVISALAYHYILQTRIDAQKLPIATMGVGMILLLIMFGLVSKLPSGRYEVVINPLRQAPAGDVSQTVAEHASMQLQFGNGKLEWPALNSYGMFLFLVPIGIVLPFVGKDGDGDPNRNLLVMLIFATFLLFLALDPYPALILYVVTWLSIGGLWFLTPAEDRPSNELMMMAIFTLLASYFFKNMIRLNILFSAFVAIQSGLSFGIGLDIISSVRQRSSKGEARPESKRRREKRRRKRKRTIAPEPEVAVTKGLDYAQLVMAGLIILLLVLAASRSHESARAYPLGLRSDWFEALGWIEENSEPDDVTMSWWDYGYWIQTYAHRPTIADGATTNWTQIRKLARAFVTTETEAVQFCREYDVRYIMVDVTDDFVGGKWSAMAVIAKQKGQDYMGIQDQQLEIFDKGKRCLLFRMASWAPLPKTYRDAIGLPLSLDEHFQHRRTITDTSGRSIVIFEYIE